MLLESGMNEPAVKIESLSRDERLDLLEKLWDSLSEAPGGVPVTPAQQAELERRSAALDQDVAKGRALELRGRRVGSRGNYPEIPDCSPRGDARGHPPDPPLQPGGDPGCGVPSSLAVRALAREADHRRRLGPHLSR